LKTKSILIIALLLAILASCAKSNNEVVEEPISIIAEESEVVPEEEKTRTIDNEDLSGHFFPLSYESDSDLLVINYVLGQPLISPDPSGILIFNGLDGKGLANLSVNKEDAATTYVLKLREGVKFSDGSELTADDLIFTYYVYTELPTEISNLPIQGIRAYRSGLSDELYYKYLPIVLEIAQNPNAPDDGINYSAEQHRAFYATLDAAWRDAIGILVDFELDNYSEYSDVEIHDESKVAAAMNIWGFGSVNILGEFIAAVSGQKWNMTDSFPTVEDYYSETYKAYSGDYAAFELAELEGIPGITSMDTIIGNYVKTLIDESGATGEIIRNISGIRKVSEYEIEITLDGYDESAAKTLFNIQPLSLKYYGDESKYDYENNQFGFDYGDASPVYIVESAPFGIGSYKFIEFKDGIVNLEKNEYYWEEQAK